MPLPNDERLIALSEEILKQFEAMFGPHPGFRPVHAKGILLRGTFTPSSAAASLTRAQHAVQASTPVTVRFSDSTGVPLIPDQRSACGSAGHGDSVQPCRACAHGHRGALGQWISGDYGAGVSGVFAGCSAERSGEGTGICGESSQGAGICASNYTASASFAKEKYFGLTAMKFTNKDGMSR
jgi:catalase